MNNTRDEPRYGLGDISRHFEEHYGWRRGDGGFSHLMMTTLLNLEEQVKQITNDRNRVAQQLSERESEIEKLLHSEYQLRRDVERLLGAVARLSRTASELAETVELVNGTGTPR